MMEKIVYNILVMSGPVMAILAVVFALWSKKESNKALKEFRDLLEDEKEKWMG